MNYHEFKFSPTPTGNIKIIYPIKYKDIVIPSGFVSNGLTAPHFVCIFGFDKFNMKELPCIVIHDFLCKNKEFNKADKYFNECLFYIGTSKIKRIIAVSVVKLHHFIKLLTNNK